MYFELQAWKYAMKISFNEVCFFTKLKTDAFEFGNLLIQQLIE